MENEFNTMQTLLPIHLAILCLARIRKAPTSPTAISLANKPTTTHGGAKGSGAPSGPANGNYRTGFWTKEAIEDRRRTRELICSLEALMLET